MFSMQSSWSFVVLYLGVYVDMIFPYNSLIVAVLKEQLLCVIASSHPLSSSYSTYSDFPPLHYSIDHSVCILEQLICPSLLTLFYHVSHPPAPDLLLINFILWLPDTIPPPSPSSLFLFPPFDCSSSSTSVHRAAFRLQKCLCCPLRLRLFLWVCVRALPLCVSEAGD